MIVDDRLHNWGRWCRVHPARAACCCSFEGHYRSPQCWEPVEPLAPPIDKLDAWELETGVRLLPQRHHAMLGMKYVLRLPDGFSARVLRRRFHLPRSLDMGATEAMAKVLLADALALPLKVREEQAVTIARRMLAA